MSKTKHKFNNRDRAYDDEDVVSVRKEDRRKQKRIDRALRTKNIEDLVELDDEGDDPENFFYNLYDELDDLE